MKKTWILLCGAFLFCVTACSGQEQSAAPSQPESLLPSSSAVSSPASKASTQPADTLSSGSPETPVTGEPEGAEEDSASAGISEASSESAPDLPPENAPEEAAEPEPPPAPEPAPSSPNDGQSFAADYGAAAYASQIIAVVSSGSYAEVSMHGKDGDGNWYEMMRTSGLVGFDGVGQAAEGCSVTPAGTYSLTFSFGTQPDPGAGLPYLQVSDGDYWVDDPDSAYYNQLVNTGSVTPDWSSAEHLIGEPSYRYAIAIDYNLDCTPGAGSAMFLHCSNGIPTYGCVSVPEADLLYILQNMTSGAYIVIS